jgi:hypothetical protein
MENFVIRFNEHERDAVLGIISRSNDIVINNVEPTNVGITIQLDDPEPVYQSLLEQIDRELHTSSINTVRPS